MAIRMVIEVDNEGRLSVEGGPSDKIVFYGLLEMVKDAARAHWAKQDLQRAIVPVGVPLMGIPRNGR
jgi:hypothetical protein